MDGISCLFPSYFIIIILYKTSPDWFRLLYDKENKISSVKIAF